MPKGLLVAFSNPLPGQEDAYNAWFGTLIQEALAVPGIVTARRYRLTSPQHPHAAAADNRYLALYDLDGDFMEIVGEATRRREAGEWAPRQGIDMSTVKEWVFEPISHTGEPQS
jgi:hypothetical protein